LVQAQVASAAAVPGLRQPSPPLRYTSNRLVRSSRLMQPLPLSDWICGFSRG
jgi:hypothetical protein